MFSFLTLFIVVKLGSRSVKVRYRSGPGWVQVGSRSAPCELWKFQYQGLSQISKRPGPGA